MKFLNKLFGKGSEGDSGQSSAAETPAPEASAGSDPEMSSEAGADEPSQTLPGSDGVPQQTLAEGGEDGGETTVPVPGEEEADQRPLLRGRLQEDPRGELHHEAVRQAIVAPEARIDFYQELVRQQPEEPFHSLSLGRVCREAQQHREAIAHYQRYLRSVMDADVFDELADLYGHLGEAYLSTSSRQIAQSVRAKGV
jgi:hypothetical protein